jgi:hypothetical protein
VADRNDDEHALIVHLLDPSMGAALELMVVASRAKA